MKYQELKSLDMYDVSLDNDKSQKVVQQTLRYYVKRALFYKGFYFVLSLVAVAFNAGIPVINQLSWEGSRLTVTIISSITTVITSTLALLGVKDVWFRYRSYAENLKSECNKYNSRVPPYDSSDKTATIQLFILKFESMYMNERKLWELQMKQNKPDGNEKDNGQ
jgi:hypothetical protein